MRKSLVILAMALFILTPVFALALPAMAVSAAPSSTSLKNDVWGRDANNVQINATDVQNNIGLGNKDPREIAASVINVILGFLGIIAVVIILLGGFKWMTGGGNEDKVGEAKKLITAGVIGLVIILAAWGLATFVINSLVNASV